VIPPVATEHKVLVLLTAARGRKPRLIEECQQVASRMLRPLGSCRGQIAVMARVDIDPFRLASKAPGYDVTLELRTEAETSAIVAVLEGIARDLPSAQPERSTVLVGTALWFIPCAPRPVRFQYLMRRRPDLSHEAYLKHYAEIHSAFGFKVRAVDGYDQLHVGPIDSAQAVTASGFGACDFDGVSQLHLPSLARFVLASPINAASGSLEDQRRFVALERSAMFSSRIVSQFATESSS
jgi:hypothetical protein